MFQIFVLIWKGIIVPMLKNPLKFAMGMGFALWFVVMFIVVLSRMANM